MRTHGMLLVAGLLLAGGAWAQETQTVSLSQRSYDVFDLTSSQPEHTYTFDVGRATQLLIDVTSKGAAVGLSVTDPLGDLIDPSGFSSFSIAAEDVPPLGAVLFEEGEHVQAVIDAPRAGTWMISVALPTGSPPALGSISTIATGGFGVAATTSRPVYQTGETAVLALLAFDGSTPVVGASVTANLYQMGSELSPTLVTLFDNGSDPDAAAGDGVYSAAIEGLAPGSYLAEVTLEAGPEQVTAATTFEVIAALARFNGTLSDNGVDTNSDGLFDFILVNLGVSVQTAGTYDVMAELRLPSGTASVLAGERVNLAAGTQTVGVRFPAAEIRGSLAANGPWQVRDARLVKVSADGIAPEFLADRVDDLGLTSAYTLAQLQRPLTIIQPGITEEALDTNGNGLYDQLNVSFHVDTLRYGLYTWTGDLRAPDGTVLDVAAGQRVLSVGDSLLSFSFAGQPIGASGLDGPYTVGNVAVYGPTNAAAVVSEIGVTRDYTSSQFEGGQVTLARLIQEVEALIITGPGGIPRAQGIRTSLLQKAQNAQAQVERGNNNAASNILDAFIHEVEAQAGMHISAADAQRLIDLATRLRDGL